jgi:hypothetical protein
MKQLQAMRQPWWAPPTVVWVFIGVFWYAICLTAAARLIPRFEEHSWTVWLLILLMLANAGANIPQFRLRRLDIAFFYLFPYWALLAAFVWSIRRVDRVSTVLFTVYATYQRQGAVDELANYYLRSGCRPRKARKRPGATPSPRQQPRRSSPQQARTTARGFPSETATWCPSPAGPMTEFHGVENLESVEGAVVLRAEGKRLVDSGMYC